MSRQFALFSIVLVLIGVIAGGLFGRLPSRTLAGNEVTSEKVLADYKEAINLIKESYAGSVDQEKATDSAMQSMLWTLDPHSSFFSREELRKLDEEQSSQFYGIGVSILQRRGGVYVQSVIPGTPADKAGIHYGDRFYSVEGKDAKDWSSSEVSKNVRGEKGTTVKVQIERVGSSAPLDVPVMTSRMYCVASFELSTIISRNPRLSSGVILILPSSSCRSSAAI